MTMAPDDLAKLQRHKFILDEIQRLNQDVTKYISLFHTLFVSTIGGGSVVFLGWRAFAIQPQDAVLGIRGLCVLLGILAAFVTLSMVVSIISWLDYRSEEVRLLDELVRINYRLAPELLNFWRWPETQFILFVLISTAATIFSVELWIVPTMQGG